MSPIGDDRSAGNDIALPFEARISFGMEMSLRKTENAQAIGAMFVSADGTPNADEIKKSPELLPRKKRHRAPKKTSIQSLLK
jgi:uncharacterized protein (DUF2342 family)